MNLRISRKKVKGFILSAFAYTSITTIIHFDKLEILCLNQLMKLDNNNGMILLLLTMIFVANYTDFGESFCFNGYIHAGKLPETC